MFAGLDVDHPDAALALLEAAGRAAGRRTSSPRGPATGRRTRAGRRRPSPRVKPGSSATVSTSPRVEVDGRQRALARLEHPEPVAIPARRVRHREPARRSSPSTRRRSGPRRSPCSRASRRRVGLAERGDVADPVVDHRQAVEVAAVLGGERGDERRPPAGHEAVLVVERRQAGEAGGDDPELAAGVGDVVDRGCRRCSGCGAGSSRRRACSGAGSSFSQTCGQVLVLPDLRAGCPTASLEPCQQMPIGRLEAAEVGVEAVARLAGADQAAGLVGADQSELSSWPSDLGEVRGADAAQRRAIGRGGARRGARLIGGGAAPRARAWSNSRAALGERARSLASTRLELAPRAAATCPGPGGVTVWRESGSGASSRGVQLDLRRTRRSPRARARGSATRPA